MLHDFPDRALVLAPQGRDAIVAAGILQDAHIPQCICRDLRVFLDELGRGAGVALLTDEAIRSADLTSLARWVRSQPPWSDFPFVLLTEKGGGLERNPAAERQMETLGNVAFLERPFHPTTLISVVKTALRGRMRQYEALARLEALNESESHARTAEAEVRTLNGTLEARVSERTGELEAANRQLVAQIAERERVESTLHQMQRLEAVGQLTSGVAHDFNNLLTVVLGNIGYLEKGFSGSADSKLLQRLSHMRLAAERGAKLTSQLLAFSRRQNLEPKSVDLNSVLTNMRDLLESSLGGSVQINTTFQDDLWQAFVDPTQIELLVLNLAINARDASPVGGSITLETSNATVGVPRNPEEPPAGDFVVISVSDSGTGMTKEVRAKAFEPFFTTKEVGKGSGLGLSQVLGFAKQSGGGMRVDTGLGKGTNVKVYLPRSTTRGDARVITQLLNGSPKHQQDAVILLVDDDDAVRDVTASMLREIGYEVLEVGSGGAALDLLQSEPKIDLAILDFAMPGMNGVEVARQVRARSPSLPVLFVTGYADMTSLNGLDNVRVLRKPFLESDLAHEVGDALYSLPA